MRYDKENVAEMSTRLQYLVSCFQSSVAGPNQFTYTGPQLPPDVRVNTKEFSLNEQVPGDIEHITKDLVARATEVGELVSLTPILTKIAEQYKAIPQYADPAKAPTLMKYAPA